MRRSFAITRAMVAPTRTRRDSWRSSQWWSGVGMRAWREAGARQRQQQTNLFIGDSLCFVLDLQSCASFSERLEIRPLD